MPDECGSETPAFPHAYIVRPEQSNEDGPAAAHTYGLPSTDFAAATAIPARPLTGTLTGASDTGARVSVRLARSSGCGWASRKARRSAAESRSNIALLCAARRDRSARLAASSRVSFAAAAVAALASPSAFAAAALASEASVSTAARREATTSMMLAWAANSPGDSLESIAPKVPKGSERDSDLTSRLTRSRYALTARAAA